MAGSGAAASTAIQDRVFKKGSTTYFRSSLFFPESVRRQVSTLYAFVRVADNFVDGSPQDRPGFDLFRARYRAALAGTRTGDPVVDDFVRLMRDRALDPAWVDAFLAAMEADFVKNEYDRLEDTLGYVYGSAEVIGLFMARILDLPEASYPFACLLGRAMQYINFIRDVDEDLRLGRRYLPLEGTGLRTLDRTTGEQDPSSLARFVRHHLALYRGWQSEAEKGFAMIPRRYRIPIKTASDMYKWTARRIESRPAIVFSRQVKPRTSRIVLQGLANVLAS